MAFFFTPTIWSAPHNTQAKPKLVDATELRLRYIHSFVEDAAAEFGLEPALIRAVIRVESNFNHRAVSHAGARGLMQIMPPTAHSLKEVKALNMEKPRANVRAGAKYLRKMINKFQGDLELALAAYNAGPGAVEKYRGIPPFKETQLYVKKVFRELLRERELIATSSYVAR